MKSPPHKVFPALHLIGSTIPAGGFDTDKPLIGHIYIGPGETFEE
jgi:hypothetical protein